MNNFNNMIKHDVEQFTKNTTIHKNGMDIISRKLSAKSTFDPIPTFKLYIDHKKHDTEHIHHPQNHPRDSHHNEE